MTSSISGAGILAPRTMTLSNMYVSLVTSASLLPAPPGPGNSRTFVIQVNGINTLLAVTISDLASMGNNTVNNVSVIINDIITLIQTDTSGSTPATGIISLQVS